MQFQFKKNTMIIHADTLWDEKIGAIVCVCVGVYYDVRILFLQRSISLAVQFLMQNIE